MKSKRSFFIRGEVSLTILLISLISLISTAFLINTQLNPNTRVGSQPKAKALQCTINQDCGKGFKCYNHTCVIVYCNEISGSKCRLTGCYNYEYLSTYGSCSNTVGSFCCVAKGVTGATCGSNNVCLSGKCVNGKCADSTPPGPVPPGPVPPGPVPPGPVPPGPQPPLSSGGSYVLTVHKLVDESATSLGIHQVSVAINPSIDHCYTTKGSICATNTYPLGTSVKLTAGAAAGYHFSFWSALPTSSGDTCSGQSTISCTVKVESTKSVTAHFATNGIPTGTPTPTPPAGATITPTPTVPPEGVINCNFYRPDNGKYVSGKCFNDSLYTCKSGVPNSRTSSPICPTTQKCFEMPTFTTKGGQQNCTLKTSPPPPPPPADTCVFSPGLPPVLGKCYDKSLYSCTSDPIASTTSTTCPSGLACYKEPDFSSSCTLLVVPPPPPPVGPPGPPPPVGPPGPPPPEGPPPPPPGKETETPTPTTGSITDTPTPGGPTDSTTPGGPTDTPIPGGVDMKINLALRLAGIVSTPPAGDTLHMKVKLAGGALPTSTDYKEADFTVLGDGSWVGSVSFTVPPAAGYKILVKPDKHLQKKFCDASPSESEPATYSCGDGAITLVAGENNFDFTGVHIIAGDIAVDGPQDGIIDSQDLTFIHEHLGSKDPADLKIGDLNLDGIIDSQDFSLVVAGLSVRSDEQ